MGGEGSPGEPTGQCLTARTCPTPAMSREARGNLSLRHQALPWGQRQVEARVCVHRWTWLVGAQGWAVQGFGELKTGLTAVSLYLAGQHNICVPRFSTV